MSIDLGLLSDIRDNPDDDTPRLILADWLEEQPDPVLQARGEFVRLQCRRSQSPARQEDLQREADLATTHAGAWLGALAGRVANHVFQRGMLRVVLTGEALEHAPLDTLVGLPEWPWVDHLVLRGFSEQDLASLANTPALAQVNTLVLHMTTVSPWSWALLFRSTHLHNLRRLNLNFDNLGADGIKLLADAKHLTRLRDLELVSNALGDSGLEALAASSVLAGVQRLRLGNNGIGDAGMIHLAGSGWLGQLRRLHLEYNPIGDSGIQALAACPWLAGLTELLLANHRATDEGAWALIHSPNLQKLERIAYDISSTSNRCQTAWKQRFARS